MLKISIHDSPDHLRFKLEGRLTGPWVDELDRCWQAAAAGRPATFDLRDLTFVDDRGSALLRRIGASGAVLEAADPAIVNETAHRRSLRHFAAAAILLSFATAVPAAAEPLSLTLKSAVETALKQNPRIAIANLNIAAAQEQATLARADLLPQVGLSVTDAVRRANIEAQLGMKFRGFPQHIGPFWVGQAGVGFQVPVLDLSAYRHFKAAQQAVPGARAMQNATREENVFLVVSQYLGGLRAAADVKAAKSRMSLAEALLTLANDLRKNGAGTRIDALRADVQYQGERQRLLESETQLETALLGLARLLNLEPGVKITLADEVSFFETPAFNAEKGLEAAWQARAEMAALDARVHGLELERRAASDARLPKVTVTGGWSEMGLTLHSMIPTYNYQANLEMPLFTGGKIKAHQAAADIELEKLAKERQDLRNRIALEVNTAAAQLESARNQTEVARHAVELANEEVAQARDRFQAGVANNIEVITAQDGLARATDNQIVALYRYNQARADLARATGQIESLYTR